MHPIDTKCTLPPHADISHSLRMLIPDEVLDEFIAIYEDEFGEEIDRAKAIEMAHRVLGLYRLLSARAHRPRRDESRELFDVFQDL